MEIQLRTLKYNVQTNSIERTLFSFDSKEKLIVISHCWGVPSVTKILGDDVLVDSPSKFKTIENLCKLTSAHIWVDFLCINQNDHQDKSAHINILPKLYKRADYTSTVIARNDYEVVHSALYALAEIANIFSRTQAVETEEFKQQLSLTRRLISACSELEYWKRTWTLQERVLSVNMFFIPYGATKNEIQNSMEIMTIIQNFLKTLTELSETNAGLLDLLVSIKRAILPGRFTLTSFEISRSCFVHALHRSVTHDFIYGRIAMLGVNIIVNYNADLDILLRETMKELIRKGLIPAGVLLPATCPDGVTHTWKSWEIDICSCHFDQRICSYFQALRYDVGYLGSVKFDVHGNIIINRSNENLRIEKIIPIIEWAKSIPEADGTFRNGSEEAVSHLRNFETKRGNILENIISKSLLTGRQKDLLKDAIRALLGGLHPLQWNQVTPIIIYTKQHPIFAYIQHTEQLPLDDGRHYFNLRKEFKEGVLENNRGRISALKPGTKYL
ncbi:hypothetical protein HK096_007043, partial [Nowakowskiella sp. JEL0078]